MRRIITILTLLFCLCRALSFGDVVINELMWQGTSLSPYDEYLELRNLTSSPIFFSATPWTIYRNDELLVRIDRGVLPSGGYYLISRMDITASALNVAPDMVTPTLVLNNSDSQYKLYAGFDRTATLIDIADDGFGVPAAGRYFGVSGGIFWSMERNNPPGDGTLPESWHSACLSENFDLHSPERGTPKNANRKNQMPAADTFFAPAIVRDSDNARFGFVAPVDFDNIPDSLQITGTWRKRGMPTPLYTARNYGFSASTDGAVILPSTHTTVGDTIDYRISLDDGQDTISFAGSFVVRFDVHAFFVNEICWGGSSMSYEDEWLEICVRRDVPTQLDRTPLFVWRKNYSGRFVRVATLNTGTLAPGSMLLISKLPPHDERTVLAVDPHFVARDMVLYDNALEIRITETDDPTFNPIDIAGDFSVPAAGLLAPAESIWATMARVHPVGDGRTRSAWKNSTAAFNLRPDVFDRGTPLHEDVPNALPTLFQREVFFSPDTGTRATNFIFAVHYADSDGTPPEYIRMFFDIDGSGTYDIDEIFPMHPTDVSPDYISGVRFEFALDSLPPSRVRKNFTFRASDALCKAGFPMPASNGPFVLPSAGLSISSDTWMPDTLDMFFDRHIISPALRIENTGDAPASIRLKIVSPDTFTYDGCSDDASGGWFACIEPSCMFCNGYMLSALFLPHDGAIDSILFDSDGYEDVVNTITPKLARGEVFGYGGVCAAQRLDAGTSCFLRFLFRAPRFVKGTRSESTHKITILIKLVVTMP